MITETNLRKAIRRYEENKQEKDIVTVLLNEEDFVEYIKSILLLHRKEITEKDLQNKNAFTFEKYSLFFRNDVLHNQIVIEVLRERPKVDISIRIKYVN